MINSKCGNIKPLDSNCFQKCFEYSTSKVIDSVLVSTSSIFINSTLVLLDEEGTVIREYLTIYNNSDTLAAYNEIVRLSNYLKEQKFIGNDFIQISI